MFPVAVNMSSSVRRQAGNPRAWLVLLILALACYRFLLVGTGHFYWSDERCFLPASALVDAIEAGDYQTASAHLFEARGKVAPARPGFVLVSVLPVLAQRGIGALLGIDGNTPQYYDIASGFNVLVTLGVTGCVFALGCVWTGRPWFGLLIAVVYSLLVNANVWVRHLVPYQESLLLFLAALWLLSVEPRSGERRVPRLVMAGLLTALGYSCYPGHYAFVVINAAAVLARSQRRIVSAAAFGLSSVAVIGAFESLARLTGRSYILDLWSMSGHINMGDPKEGYAFVWHYLRDVEETVGIALFTLFCGFAMLVLWRPGAQISRAGRTAMIAAVGCYLFHASLGVLLGRMVFYGRVLMIYLPFIVGGAVLALTHIGRPRLRRISVCGLLIASVYSFSNFASEYSRLAYPAEFLRDTMLLLGRDVSYPPNILWGLVDGNREETVESLDSALVTVADSRPDGSDFYVLLASHSQARESNARFLGVNLKFMGYIRDRYDRFIPPEGYRLVGEALHTEVFAANGFEGRKPWERKRIRRRRYTMRIYERAADDSHLTSLSGT